LSTVKGARAERVAVVGAGVGGLVAAVDLASRGVEVLVLERAPGPGGKMREVRIGDARIDAGPTVLTMRWVFDELFADAGASLDDAVGLRPARVLARHAWSERERLDLYADEERSADAIGALAGSGEARGFRRFCERARDIYETLEGPFLRSPRPGPLGLTKAVGPTGLGDLWRIRPFHSLWRVLGEYFRDPRLRQLFGRYATYVGSSPFAAPATLMLIAHVESRGVWLVDGGMYRIALALAGLAERLGASFRYGAAVTDVRAAGGRVREIGLETGERLEVDAAVVNADVAAVASGALGPDPARAVPAPRPAARSLSALTWSLLAPAEGFPLHRHTVFFSRDYRAEFEDLFRHRRLPREPTVYVCAQDRGDDENRAPEGAERLFCLVNAPATGDREAFTPAEIRPCEEQTFRLLSRCGLRLRRSPDASVTTTPAGFERLFPRTAGALYGQVNHGWRASFRRPGPRTALPGLYLAGGSTHPGAGVPMAALSGRLAARALLADSASTAGWRPKATSGGTSTR